MPKTKLSKFKDTKQKLSPAERSQVAKDRWAKRRADKAMEEVVVTINTMLEQDAVMGGDVSTTSAPTSVIVTTDAPVTLGTPPTPQPPEQSPVAPESVTTNPDAVLQAAGMRVQVEADGGRTLATAPQLAPAAPKKAKRYAGPKEFSVALKAAESRLAKAIVERAQAAGQLAALQAEIPSLVQIINALKGPQNIPVAPYGWEGPGPVMYPAPAPQFQPQPYVDPLAAIQSGQNIASAPVSRAQGGAIQFSPEILGSLEGPEDDDDPDKYITGPLAGVGWK